MATQPLFQSYNPPVPFPTKSDIRVGASKGAAAVAVDRAVAKLPPVVRDATLDEITIAEQAAAAIRQAHLSLTPAYVSAFLKWGAAASALATESASDQESSERLDVLLESMDTLSETQSGNLADLVFKTYVLALEATDSSCFGPMRETSRDEDSLVENLGYAAYRDIRNLDPLPAMLDQLGAAGWRLSTSTVAYTRSIGDAITGAFTRAIAIAGEANADIGHLGADPHTAWLADRNRAQATINAADETLTDEAADALSTYTVERDLEISKTPATTRDGVLAKLALIAQISLEGWEPNMDWCASALVDAQRVAGVGSLAGAVEERHRDMAA